jgi:HKD family nuclease
MPSMSSLFEKQFGILIGDVNKLVVHDVDTHAKIDMIVKQYGLRGFLPDDYIINNFNKYIRIPYGEHIMSKNADFFMNQEFTHEDLETESKGIITHLTEVFKKLWTNGIDDATKEKIWTRMQILTKLCDRWENESRS